LTKAYISATLEDLKECRQAVRNALSQLELGFKTMEVYVAEGRAPLERCLKDIDACEIYIGIFAWRYGYIPLGETKSITHLEFEHAVRSNKHCLIFLLDDKALWPVLHVDRGPAAAKVDELRRIVSAAYLCKFFTSADQLALQVVAAVTNYVAENSRSAEEAAEPTPEQSIGPRMSVAVRQQYFDRLAQNYGRIDLDALVQQQPTANGGIPLAEVFVEPLVREVQPAEFPREVWRRVGEAGPLTEQDVPEDVDPAELTQTYAAYYEKPAVPVLDALCAPGERAFVLLGDPGSGKSIVVRFLALALAGQLTDERVAALGGPLPIVIELRSYAAFVLGGGGPGFVDYLIHRADTDGYRTEPRGLENHLLLGDPAVAIFDGLDEIFDRNLRTSTAERIAAFAAEFPKVRVIVTSRGPDYPRRALAGAISAHYTLQELTHAETADFLGRWFRQAMPDRPAAAAQRRDMLTRVIRQSRELSELAGNPMLLSILAIVGQRRILPHQRWSLYDHAATLLVDRWDAVRMPSVGADSAAFVDADDKRELLRRVAFEMQNGQSGLAGNYLHTERLKQIFADYLGGHYRLDAKTANTAAAALLGQLRERDFILTSYGPHMWGFVHRTFLEFFCAWAIVREFQHTQRYTFADIKKIFQEHWADPSWHEVLRLIGGRLPTHQTAEIAELLVTGANPGFPPPAGGGAAVPAEPPWNIPLAVQCVAEMRPISDGERVAGLVLRHAQRLIEYCAYVHDPAAAELIGEEILPAIDAVGPQWPGRAGYLSWYRRQAGKLLAAPTATYAARMAAMLADPADRVEEAFAATVTSLGNIRLVCAAVTGLAEVVRQAPRRDPTPDTTGTRQLLVELASTDERAAVRSAAVQALGAIPGPDETVRAVLIRRAAADPSAEVRLIALQVMVEAFPHDAEVEAALLGGPRADPNATVRRAAVRALIRPRNLPIEVEESLLDACRMDGDAEVIEAAAQALLVRPGTAERVRQVLLHRLTTDPAAGVRRAAVRLLGADGYDNEMIDRLTQDEDRTVVREAARVVAGRRDAPVDRVCEALIARLRRDADEVMRAALVRMVHEVCGTGQNVNRALADAAVQDRSQSVRLAAVTALADRPAGDQARALFAEVAVRDPDPPVRLAAVQALTADRGVAATAALAAIAVGDPVVEVRVKAVAGLDGRDLDQTIGEQLVGLIDDQQHPQIRLAALGVLKNTRPRGVDLPAVFRERTARDTVAYVFAAAAAAAVENVDSIAQLWEVIAKRAASDDNPQVRSAAVTLLGAAAGYGQTLGVLTERLRHDADPAVIGVAATAVAVLAPDSARDVLMARLAAPDPEVRAAVVEALERWTDADAGVRLAVSTAAGTDKSALVRRTAVEALAPAVKHPEVQETLTHCADDDDLSVSEAADRLLRFRPL